MAVVEYIGSFPAEPVPHGNARKSDTEYIQSQESVKQQINERILHRGPRDVYEELALKGSRFAPRDLEQVQNAKYRMTKYRDQSEEQTKRS